MNDYAMEPMNRWDKLDPDVRKRLEIQSKPAPDLISNGTRMNVRPANNDSTTKPSEQTLSQSVKVQGQGTIIFVPTVGQNNIADVQKQQQPRDPVLGSRLQMEAVANTSFAPNNVGLLLDEAGHVLVPMYIEARSSGGVAHPRCKE